MTSYCLKCRSLVPSWIKYSDGMVYLAKNCQQCGPTQALIERDWRWVLEQDEIPRTDSQNDCFMVDITGKCDAGCRSCYHQGGEHKGIDAINNEFDAVPVFSRLLLSGGEPLQHPEVAQVVQLASELGLFPVLLTNGAGLTPTVLERLLHAGLEQTDGVPQVAVSLGFHYTNRTFVAAYENVKQIQVADIAFSVSYLDELKQVEEIAESLRGHYDTVCIRTSWDGSATGLFVSDIVRVLGGDLIPAPTLHGYRNAMVVKNGITYKILSWPNWKQYDCERYQGRGVWYGGDNVVSTLVKNHVASISL